MCLYIRPKAYRRRAYRGYTATLAGLLLILSTGVTAQQPWGTVETRPESSTPVLPLVSANDLAAPSSARAHYQRAIEDFRKNKFDSAEKHLTQALKQHAQFPVALVLKAMLEVNAGQLDAAKNTLQQAIDMDPKNFAAHLILGSIYADTSRLEDAMTEFRRALLIRPSDWVSYVGLAQAEYMKRQDGRALEDIEKAERLIRSDALPVEKASLHLVKGYILRALKRYSQAEKEFQTVLAFGEVADDYNQRVKQQLANLRELQAHATQP